MTSSTALYSVAEIRHIEHAALATLPPGTLMQRAGAAAAELALSLLRETGTTARVLVFAGPGNNGGDALETAYFLAQSGVQVSILLYADPARFPTDAQQALQRARSVAAHFADTARLPEIVFSGWSLVIDGLFGIGLTRPLSDSWRIAADAINTVDCPVLALDVPSGLDADTGNIVGDSSNGIAVRATHTITFIGNKPGLHTCFGRDYAGEVHVASLGIEPGVFTQANATLNRVELFSASLHRRSHNSHKGSYGDVIVVGGAAGMAGAAILSARAAAKCGAGRVFAGFLENAPAYDSAQPELMCRIARDLDFNARTLVVGPGLGMSQSARDMLVLALNANTPLVLDADALNLIAADQALQELLMQRGSATIMTPHPLEAARLLSMSSAGIQADRLAAARKLAARFGATIILKGSGSVIAQAGNGVVINTTGNPGLATAGTGDVLAGICGALLAQNASEWQAALAATWLHGKAADILVDQGIGPVGLTASELISCVRSALNQLINEHG
jgi:hydroxyethylthiazole kinase-like uncharacterized protein yjeF